MAGQDVCRSVDAAVGLGCRRISLDLSSGGLLCISALSGPLSRVSILDDLTVHA